MKFLMCIVAVHASHGPRFMRAASPEQLVSAGVTLQTSRVLLGYCILRIVGKADWNRLLGPTRLDVYTARTVTGFATSSFVGGVRMRHCFAHCCSVKASALILVTGDTCIATDIIAIGLGVSRLNVL